MCRRSILPLSIWPMIVLLLTAQEPATPGSAPIDDIPIKMTKITGGLLADRQDANRRTTALAVLDQCEKTGRIENFRRAAGPTVGKHQGYFFNDSDVYKAIEGAATVLEEREAFDGRDKIATILDDWIALIAKAQMPDGYIYTYRQLGEDGGVARRFSNMKDQHELYCMGHLIEAGVAHHRATGRTNLLDVAKKAADLIGATFGKEKRHDVCGHEEIELALIKLGRHLGEPKYIDLARFFVDLRGTESGREKWGEYYQDHLPVRDHDRVVGHAVRSTYLYCAATDLCLEKPDDDLFYALDRVWSDLTKKKMYVTGGIGTSAANEGFTKAYDLPNESAYAETCAGIGLVFWADRMNRATGDAAYIDVLERALLNAVFSGVSLGGDRFFYDNPLASDGSHRRVPFFGCACCPPNIVRAVGSMGQYVFKKSSDTLYVNLFNSAETTTTIGGEPITVRLSADQPFSDDVAIACESRANSPWRLAVRKPRWAKEFRFELDLGGGKSAVLAAERDGYAFFDMPVRNGCLRGKIVARPTAVRAHPAIAADRGKIAVAWGPYVYAAEEADNGEGLDRLILPETGEYVAADFAECRAVKALEGTAAKVESYFPSDEIYALTSPFSIGKVRLVPYFAWANRAPGEMSVWFAGSGGAIDRLSPGPSLKWSVSQCFERDTIDALGDGILPENSSDQSIPRHSFWPRKGSTEWAAVEFDAPRVVRSVEAWFFDDQKHGGGCRLPVTVAVETKRGEAWVPAEPVRQRPAGADQSYFSRIKPVKTTGVRVQVTLAPGFSGGILELSVR